MTTDNKQEQQEIEQFRFNLRSIGGYALDAMTRLAARIDTYFGWSKNRKAKIEQEAEESFNKCSSKIEDITVG